MKLKVVGWTYYDDCLEEGSNGWAARSAIIDEIKKHGYMFSGWAHQKCDCCTPVLNDGKMYCYSQRGWGDLMAEAHGYTGRMDYAKFAFEIDDDAEIRPQEYFDEENFSPEYDLSERFEIEVSDDIFESAKKEYQITLEDLPELSYLDFKDTLVLTCGEKKAEFSVWDVERKRDLTEEKRLQLEVAFYDFNNKERMKKAEEEFNNTKIIMIIKFKKKAK